MICLARGKYNLSQGLNIKYKKDIGYTVLQKNVALNKNLKNSELKLDYTVFI